MAREMLNRHDWITPVLNGVPWLEKPALFYWCTAVSYKVFGVSDWVARLPSALFATVMIAAIYAFARRLLAGVQLDAALIAASSAAAIGFARGASTDMPLAATFTIAMLAWFCWRDSAAHARTRVPPKLWLTAFYVMMALGTLAKGPVAPVLAGAIIVVFAFMPGKPESETPATRPTAARWRLIRETLWLPGVLLFLAIALPWYVAVQIQTPEFFRVFVLEHNLERFGTNLYRHKQPFWYYAPVFLLSTLPWMVYVITAAAAALRGPTSTKSLQTSATVERRFLLIWVALPLVFFTISQSKLPGYILPAVPPCALLLAEWLRARLSPAQTGKPDLSGAPESWVPAIIHSLVCGLLLGGALLSPYFISRQHPAAQARTIAAVAAAVIAAAMLASLRWQGLRALRFVTLVPVVLGLAFVLRVSAPVIDQTQSARPVAQELSRLETRRAPPLAGFNIRRETEYGLDFYRNQPVLLYERGQMPPGDHLLIARAGSEPQLEAFLGGRRLSHVGGFAPQNLEFYWVSTGTVHHHH